MTPADGSSCDCVNCLDTAAFSSSYTIEYYCSTNQRIVMNTLSARSTNPFPDKFIVYTKPNCQTTSYYPSFSQVTPSVCIDFTNYRFSSGASRLCFEFRCIDPDRGTCRIRFQIAGSCYNQKKRTFSEVLTTQIQPILN
ncbi:unnamed protein product [Rotaria sp. Silwood1]|nr:unnamed protein product [Rotaria sp. Silwood1]